MKIIYACETDFADTGGHVTHISQFVEAMQELKCEVQILAPRLGKYDGPARLPITYLPCIRYRFLAFLSYEVVLFFYLIGLLMRNRLELIYVRSELYTLGAPLFASLFKRPLVVEVNSLKLNELRARQKKQTLIRLVDFTLRQSLQKADRIVCTARKITAHLRDEYNVPADKIEFVHNAANTRVFRPESKEEALRKTNLNMLDGHNVVGFSGNIVAWQGLENLVAAAKILCREMTHVRFLVVGDGPQRSACEEMVRESGLDGFFHFAGMVRFEEVPNYLNACDICVIPRNEGVVGEPIKLYEYMSCAKPVVASNIEGFEIVEAENIGVLAVPGDASDLAGKIQALLANPELRAEMGRRARGLAEAKFNWHAIARQTLAILNELLDQYHAKN